MSQMSMSTTATAAAASATSTTMSMGGSCKISMLWNWYTIDSCFIASTWHVTSKGAFAGSCIGVICLVVALEFLRRFQREFDRYLHRVNGSKVPASSAPCCGDPSASDGGSNAGFNTIAKSNGVDRLKLWQQLARSALFTAQFAVGYIVMLLAMYFNGYIIISIFIGAFIGATLFQWDTYSNRSEGPETRDSCCN